VILFLATVTECIQIWVPTRSFNIMDWVANVAGIGLGVIVIKIAEGRFKNAEGR
jgi:VanZ family protein